MKWFRLWNDMIHDSKIHEMTDSEFRVFIYLLCLASGQETRGVIPLKPTQVSRILRLHTNKVTHAIETFQKMNILEVSNSNPEIIFINWDKRQFKSDDSYSRVKRFRNVTVTPPDTDTDTDTEKEREESELPVQTPCPYQKIRELYNTKCKSLPALLKMSRVRKSKLKTRWREQPDLVWWDELFERVEATPFCCGDNERGWKASFDWLIANDTNALKVLEGKYDETERSKPDGLTGCVSCTVRAQAVTMDIDESGVCWSCRRAKEDT